MVTVRGRGQLGAETLPKCRVFVMEDHSVVLITPGDGGLVRQSFEAVGAGFERATQTLTVHLSSGQTLTVFGKGCGCGMGAVGNAGPTEDPYRLSKVRAPEWYSET